MADDEFDGDEYVKYSYQLCDSVLEYDMVCCNVGYELACPELDLLVLKRRSPSNSYCGA